jgi:MFS family permease
MDASPHQSARRSWMLLGASFVTFLVSSACMQSYAVFLVAFIEEFGWTRGESTIAYSVSQLVSGVTSPLVGVLVDRLGPRRLVLFGGILLALRLFTPFGSLSCSTGSS